MTLPTSTVPNAAAPLRAALVDDEPLARALLRSMLAEQHADVTIAGEAGDGDAAVRLVREERPDLLFLDIQMPERDGFDVIAALAADEETDAHTPWVVFVTAYDHFAVRAFEVNAIDYLLKPFDEERLALTMARVRELRARAAPAPDARQILALLDSLVPSAAPAPRPLDRLAIRVGERIVLQPLRDVCWIEASGKLIRVHVGKGHYTMRETLQSVEQLLDPGLFVRISRSAIVNIDQIREIQPWFHGDLVVILKNGAQVPTTRGWRAGLETLLGQS